MHGRKLLAVWLAAFVWLVDDIFSLAKADTSVPTQQVIAGEIARRWQGVESLYVDWQQTGLPLVRPPVLLKKYLQMEFWGVTQGYVLAYKGLRRYEKEYGPASTPWVAPDVEPDWDVIPGGSDQKRKNTERYEQNVQQFGKEAVDRAHKKARARPIPLHSDCECAFDGECMRRRLEKRSADIWSKDKLDADEGWFSFSHGYCENSYRALPDPFKPSNDRASMRLPDASGLGGWETEPSFGTVDGVRCVVLKRSNKERLWLAVPYGYAVIKREVYDGESGKVETRWVNKEFVKVFQELWLPYLCWREQPGPPRAPRGVSGVPLLRYVLKIKKLTVNQVPDSLFVVKIPPGIAVVDVSILPKKGDKLQPVQYYMPANPSQLQEAIDRALELKHQEERGAWWRAVIMGGIVLLFLAAVLILVLNRYGVGRVIRK